MPRSINTKNICMRKTCLASWAFKIPFSHHRSQITGWEIGKIKSTHIHQNQRPAIYSQSQRASGFTLLDDLAAKRSPLIIQLKNSFRRYKPRASASHKAFYSPPQLQKLKWPENELRKADPYILRFKIIRPFSLVQASDLTRYNIYPDEQELRIKLALQGLKYEYEPIARAQSAAHLEPP